MKKSIFVGAALIGMMGLGAGQLEAQAPLRFNVGVGPTIPIGDDKGTGVHLNAGVGLGLPMLPFGLRLEGMVQRIPEGDDHHDYLGGTLNAEVALPMAVVRPYLIGGAGFVWHREHHGDHHHDPHTDFAFNVGVGTEFGLFGLSAYAEARYHRLLNGSDDHGHGHGHGHGEHTGNTFIPLTIGIRF